MNYESEFYVPKQLYQVIIEIMHLFLSMYMYYRYTGGHGISTLARHKLNYGSGTGSAA
jgi:prolipoprotein diacylglyceryltransferase